MQSFAISFLDKFEGYKAPASDQTPYNPTNSLRYDTLRRRLFGQPDARQINRPQKLQVKVTKSLTTPVNLRSVNNSTEVLGSSAEMVGEKN